MPDATHVAGRLPLVREEAAIAQGALAAARREFDASPAGIARRIRLAARAQTEAEGVE